MGRKRRKGPDDGAGELPLEAVRVRLNPVERQAKEHDLHLKIRARTAIKSEKDEANRKFNGELDQLDEDIKRMADELLLDTEMQKQRDLFVSTDQARQGLAAVAATGRKGHAFIEPAADKIAEGEAPRCAFPDCGRFADETVHEVAPHPYAGENGGPCACGEAKESPCHQVAQEAGEGGELLATITSDAKIPDEVEDVFRTDPKAAPHAFQDGPLRAKGGVHLCTDCEQPEADARHHEKAEPETAAAPVEALEGGGAGA